MITELSIEGFKSFGSPSETIELGPLNFVVGANGSGKSNLLFALRFLQNAVVQDISYAVSEMGGSAEVRNKRLRQRREPKPVRFALKVEKEVEYYVARGLGGEPETSVAKSFDYELVLDLRSDDTTPYIESERLRVETGNEGDENTVGLDRSGREVVIIDSVGDGDRDQTIHIPEQEATRLALAGVGFFSISTAILAEEVKRWRFHNFVPSIARQPYRQEPDAILGPAGEKLAAVLSKMSGADRASIAEGLRAIVPGLKGIKTTKLPIEDTLAFQIVEEKLKAAINPISVSDGTVRLLALLVATTWSVRNSSLIAIEEPENGVHPHLAQYLVDILKSASDHAQVVVTTHAPDLLDYLEPSEVVLCDKEDGFTKLMKASSVSDIEQFRKHFSLGELWSQGAVGAVP